MFSVHEEIKKLVSDGCLLDVGCGDGSLLKKLSDSFECYGIDLSRSSVRRAYLKGVNARVYDATLPFPFNASFNIVTLINVLEFVRDPKQVLINCNNALVTGGYLIIKFKGDALMLSDLLFNTGFALIRSDYLLNLFNTCFKSIKLLSNEVFLVARKFRDL